MKTVFLDRDGVINRCPGDHRYVSSSRKFEFLSRAKKAIALLRRKKFRIFIISNQAGVGAGVYQRKTLDRITQKMLADIESAGGRIQKVYYCTHRKDAGCSCRKPKPGLLLKAAKEFQIDLKKVYLIGDTINDVLTADAVGARSILVLTGKEKLAHRSRWKAKPKFVFKDLYSAARFLR